MHPKGRSFFLAALFATCVAQTGCDETLGPRQEAPPPFTLYGVFSPDLDTQSVLVYPVEDFPSLGSPEPLDALVQSIHEATGERTLWRDSVVTNEDGHFRHVFWAPFRAEFGDVYRLVAERQSDGAASEVDVRIPVPVDVEIVDDSNAGNVQIGISGGDVRLLSPELVYRVFKPDLRPIDYSVSYAGREEQTGNGWRVGINMVTDAYRINFLYNGEAGALGGSCRKDFITLESLRLRAVIGDTVWAPPRGIFDPNELADPSQSNVENGFGFVSAGYRIDVSLYPSEEAVAGACMLDDVDRSQE